MILPQCKPALAVLGLFTFVFQWNEFLWPLIATSRTEMRTLPNPEIPRRGHRALRPEMRAH